MPNDHRRVLTLILLLLALAPGCGGNAQQRGDEDVPTPWSVRMADSVIARHPQPAMMERTGDEQLPKWSYSAGFLTQAVAEVGVRGGEQKYIDFARRFMDAFIDERGTFTTPTYKPATYKLDDVAPGRVLLLLHKQSREARWLAAADTLAQQLKTQPRTANAGFWHKQIYPHQMWLDGIFMASPFMTEYATVAADPSWQDEATRQILTIAAHTRDAKTGLYFHGWDESRTQKWADPKTGLSPCLWGRAVGWYAMGIVDTLESLRPDHPRRKEIVSLLEGLADAIARVQDRETGLWYQVLDQPTREGNYLESSAACMFVYALAKAVRLGLLEPRYGDVARRGYDGIVRRFISVDPQTGLVSLNDTCQVAGLGGNPYRDGSFAYYISEPRISNDPKGVAPFILASLEMEQQKTPTRIGGG